MTLAGLALSTLAIGGTRAQDSRPVSRVDPMLVPPAKTTRLALYLTAAELLAAMASHPDLVIVDVRDRRSARSEGPVGLAAYPVPYLIPVAGGENETRTVLNPRFAAQVRARLALRRLDQRATVVLLCSVGIVSAQAADHLADRGFTGVHVVIDGITGLRTAR